MNYITSDLHFWHKNILKFSKEHRPFDTIEEMNNYIVNKINDTCTEDDTLYHLGDFSFAGKEKTRAVLDRIKCKIVFILGNHCYHMKSLYEEYGEVLMYKETKVNGVKTVLFHYPIATCNGQGRGSVHLHGHCHGSYEGLGRILEVGYCAHGRLLKIEEAVNMALEKEIYVPDHHAII